MNARLFALADPPRAQRRAWAAHLAAACGVHLTLALSLAGGAPLPAERWPVTEVVLEAPPPPSTPSPPEPERAHEPPPPAAAAPPKRMRERAPDPAPVARAGALLTATDAPDRPAEAPVRFVTDPNGRGYGTGIVARGGLAEHGSGNTVTNVVVPVATSDHITPADKLRQQPVLLGDGCRGFFPDRAVPDQGQVSVIATVSASGNLSRLEIESEAPAGEGFGRAARACLAKRRFTPALDEHGEPTAARTRINLRFTR